MTTENDLTIQRVIKAPPTTVWQAWKDPSHFVKWWAPAPVKTVSNKHDMFTGGGFDTTMHLPDGTVMEGGEGCFLEVVEYERIVFTDALRGGWRPNETAFFTAIITLKEHPDGTLYTATALHKNDADRQQHEEMGFLNGWGTALDQLSSLVETL
ncbi:SRPBCC family protein [Parvularcula sp. IMCC14364]|uniref:SRPBCC family protein n=1 Tax=Parvularcula sp. IMCC14364 TaxID=3067902 RepID=UPI002740A938|nr:SRPBCC family protein [Parvularcula sp. IMCC14364]